MITDQVLQKLLNVFQIITDLKYILLYLISDHTFKMSDEQNYLLCFTCMICEI